MTPEQRRAYSRGYQAGRRKLRRQLAAEQAELERKAFAERLFVSLLPVAIDAQGWNMDAGGKQIKVTKLVDRIELAVRFVRQAMKRRSEL